MFVFISEVPHKVYTPFSPIIQNTDSVELVSRKRQMRRAKGKEEKPMEMKPDAFREGRQGFTFTELGIGV